MPHEKSLITSYRPKTFDEYIADEAMLSSIRKTISEDRGRAYLISGPSGCGKTTLARIILSEVGVDPLAIQEVDAATKTGIDDIRMSLEELGRPVLLAESSKRGLIIDETQALSKQAVTSLLKTLEEPPFEAWIILCTTELNKIPKPIQNRCLRYTVKEMSNNDLTDLLKEIAEAEGISLPKGGLKHIVQAAEGVPREGLSLLAICSDAKTLDDIETLAGNAGIENKEIIDLCRALGGGGVREIFKILNSLKDSNITNESIRIMVFRYFTTVALRSNNDSKLMSALAILEAFKEPCYPPNGIGEIILSVSELLFSEEDE